MVWPLLEIAIEPRSIEARERLVCALKSLAAKDPAYRWTSVDPHIILGGLCEDHLLSAVNTLRDELMDEIFVGAAQVAYRERLGQAATIDHTYKRRTNGSGEIARVKIEFEPSQPGSSYKFENNLRGNAIPSEYVRGIEHGIEMGRNNGLLAGFPVIEFTARLTDGSFHDLDSNEGAFQIAAQGAFRELRDKANPKLAEPIMKVEVLTTDDYADRVAAALIERRAKVQTRSDGKSVSLIALVPLATLFGYTSALQAITGGAHSHSMILSHYADMADPDDDPTFRPAVGMRA